MCLGTIVNLFFRNLCWQGTMKCRIEPRAPAHRYWLSDIRLQEDIRIRKSSAKGEKKSISNGAKAQRKRP